MRPIGRYKYMADYVPEPVAAHMADIIEESTSKVVDVESAPVPERKRRQPFSAVATVVACGFALMSDGNPSHYFVSAYTK
jgi:hypothetical protein